jgi:hypothetical protein
MGVVICLPLFGPPDRELEEQPFLQGRHLRKLAADLNERLQKAADILDRLTANGWSARLAMYEAILSQAGIETREEAERRLRALGVAVEDLFLIEEVDEEDGDNPSD